MEEFSHEKASKFSREHMYFNVNHLWAPGFMSVVRLLYYTPVRPEFIVFISFITGITSAWLYSLDNYYVSLLAASLIVIKNFLDNVDGHLARAKGLASRLGRFLDSLSDAFVYFFLFTGIACNISTDENIWPVLVFSYIAMIMAFIHCSFYNYYLVTYKTFISGRGINRTDESFGFEEKKLYKEGLYGMSVIGLQWIYQFVYGWQDTIVKAIDRYAYKKFKAKNAHLEEKEAWISWYTNKKFIAWFSPLCFGTQIFTLFLFTIWDNLTGFLFSLIAPWNLYLLAIFFLKINSTHQNR